MLIVPQHFHRLYSVLCRFYLSAHRASTACQAGGQAMKEEVAGFCPADCNWEQRQKHASFFQTQIGSVQQAALAATAFSTILLTATFAFKDFSDLSPDEYWIIVIFGVFLWFLSGGLTVYSFGRSARRIRNTYLSEHAMLFPGSTPYSLESYLLNFAEKTPCKH